MSRADEERKGYIAIGEAVISHIVKKQEISKQSLLKELGKMAVSETCDERASRLRIGRELLNTMPDEPEADASGRYPGGALPADGNE
ncbi:hypothetical protein [Superficieibacter sp.]|uniref:hypothetical protein n=1 Tax=Superficieibacter sp. TaxID=2303322 RepID=UPI0028A8B931|nr:hypothetical protein [Superficieibacter sp.]